MTVRTPVYEDNGNLKEMSSAMIDQIVAKAIYLYSLNPSVTLSRVSSGGNLGSLTDSFVIAGAAISRADRFATQGETNEPSTSTQTFEHISQSTASVSQPADTGGVAFPLFVNSGNLQAMSGTDFLDTFIEPAITSLQSGSTGTAQGGTYFVSTSTSVSGATAVSGSRVFRDRKANVGAYTAGGIPETLTQTTTVANYYLHRINGADSAYTVPAYARTDNNIQVYTTSNFNTLLQNYIRWAAVNHTGYRISYAYGGSGNTRGSFTNTFLTGVTGNYKTRKVNNDDYRAQEFPNGTETTTSTPFKIRLT